MRVFELQAELDKIPERYEIDTSRIEFNRYATLARLDCVHVDSDKGTVILRSHCKECK